MPGRIPALPQGKATASAKRKGMALEPELEPEPEPERERELEPVGYPKQVEGKGCAGSPGRAPRGPWGRRED